MYGVMNAQISSIDPLTSRLIEEYSLQTGTPIKDVLESYVNGTLTIQPMGGNLYLVSCCGGSTVVDHTDQDPPRTPIKPPPTTSFDPNNPEG